MQNLVPFLNPVYSYGASVAPAELEMMTRWLVQIAAAVREDAGSVERCSEGVSESRFGWDDIRRVFYASSCEKADRPEYFVEAYASLRDGRFVRIHGDFGVKRDDFRKETVTVEAWSQADWDAFYGRIQGSMPDPDDVDDCRHIEHCGTLLEFLHHARG